MSIATRTTKAALSLSLTLSKKLSRAFDYQNCQVTKWEAKVVAARMEFGKHLPVHLP